MEATAQAGQAPQAPSAAGGAGRAGEQWDSSVHAWLEDRAAGDQVLISIHDDATSRLMMARFVERDDGAENRRAIIGYLQRHGRPLGGLHGPCRARSGPTRSSHEGWVSWGSR